MPKEAQASSAKLRYTAIAVSPSLLAYSYANGYTKTEATSKALDICLKESPKHSGYTGDCQGASWVKNGYVALAFEKTLEKPYATAQWGSDWAYNKSFAKHDAKLNCSYKANETCKTAIFRRSPTYTDTVYSAGGSW
jgi:hypothetical protein